MSILQVRLLGDFQITYQGKPLNGFESPRIQSLLAFLLLHRDAPQSRKHLAFSLWQDSSEQQAHGNLRSLVHRLRAVLPTAELFLSADTQTLQWRADAPFTLDVDEFQNAAQSKSHPALQKAVDLYRGDLLPACYDEWLLPERERLREQFIDTLAQLIVLSEAEHEYQAAIGYARRLLQADPLGEEAYRKLMHLYARTGDRANLVRVYQTCVAVLKRELDAEPSPATHALFERLRDDETLVEPALQPRPQPKPNLPVPLTSFVGRTHELDEIRALLQRARLVTLMGIGGGGKTRLAIQAAHAVENLFAGGVWFVDLASLSDPAAVPGACAAVFGLREQVGTTPIELLAAHLRAQELLLVLDNCEHLLAACAILAQTILLAAPRVRILATSREPLNLAGEALLSVPPLSMPGAGPSTLEILAHSDAVQLFSARAAFNLPTFTLNQSNLEAVAQICRRLDGIPLAIELAAARIRALTPAQIAGRLDDALAVLTRGSASLSTRHQTMRAVLDWSDALLSDPERVLFRRLSVFAGGFTLEASEQVCADPPLTPDPRPPSSLAPSLILDLLSNLIDKSLVTSVEVEQGDEARYRLLEPTRQYAREKLHAAGEQEPIAARHLAWCVALGERMEKELEGAGQAAGFLRLDREHDNLRAALEFALHSRYRESGLRLAAALERFWLLGGHSIEGRGWFKQLLAPELAPDTPTHPAEPIHPTVLARAFGVAGALAWRQNTYDEAEACNQQSLRLWQELQNQAGVALALKQLGDVARTRGESAHAVELHQQSLTIYRQLQDHRGIANVQSSLGATLSEQGDYARAMELYQEGLALSQQLGDLWLTAMFTNNLGVALREQDADRAETLFRETLALRRSLRDRLGEAITVRNLGEMALKRRDWVRARAMFTESMSLHSSMHNYKGVAECLIGLAWVEHAQGCSEHAATLMGASEHLRETIRASLPEDDRAEYDDLVSLVRQNLDPHAFATVWSDGRALTPDQAVAYALERHDPA